MREELKDILSNNNKDIDNEKLMAYLGNELSKADVHDLEKDMTDDAFLNDAIEGLQAIPDQQHVQAYVEQLNKELKKHTDKNKKRKEKRKLKDNPMTYLVIVIVLLLIILSFIILRKQLSKQQTKQPVLSTQVISNKE